MNLEKDVRISATDTDGTITSFTISAAGAKSYEIKELKLTNVQRIDIYMDGPTGITHLGLCYDLNGRPTSSPDLVWPTDMPSMMPSKSPAPPAVFHLLLPAEVRRFHLVRIMSIPAHTARP